MAVRGQQLHHKDPDGLGGGRGLGEKRWRENGWRDEIRRNW